MTNTSTLNPAIPKTADNLKLVVFAVGRLSLALPIHSVAKILKGVAVSRSGINQFGVAHLGETEITVVDLHKRLFHQEAPAIEASHNYLLVSQLRNGEVVGIEVPQTPAIFDVPTSQIRTLPPSYRTLDTLAIASHVTVLPQDSGDLTVFVLDVDQLISS